MGRALGIAALIVASAAISYVVGIRRGKSYSEKIAIEEQVAVDATTVAALGTLQPLRGIVNISALPGDEIGAVLVAEGAEVSPGDPLVILKSRELRALEHRLATQRFKDAEKRITVEQQVADSKLKAAELAAQEAESKRQDLDRESANLTLLRKRVKQEQESLDDLQMLANDAVTSEVVNPADVRKQVLLLEKLNSDVTQGEAALESAEESYRLAIDAAAAQLEAAKLGSESVKEASPLGALQAAIDLAALNLEMTKITAPDLNDTLEFTPDASSDASDAENKPRPDSNDKLRVLRVIARKGERVTNMPLLQLADVSEMCCIAEVYEANLSDIKKRMTATMSSRALQVRGEGGQSTTKPLTGTVIKIGQVIGRPSLPNPNPLSRQDIRTAEVIIKLEGEDARRAASWINLQVNVRFDMGESQSNESARESTAEAESLQAAEATP